ncbi:MAG: flippase-like domain-containing protein [Gammaproteobacteria bacterium]|nr:flippase-like domain-containing protein [Gammaproteobacteria bacterium]MDH5262667.1 flippase-like domain-containing protein [Gammaproteobacteria bacterium]
MNSAAIKSKSLRSLLFAVGLAASSIFLWLSFRNTDVSVVSNTVASADPTWVGPFLVCLFLFYWLKSRRWCDLLSPIHTASTSDLFPAVMIGYAGTAILPMQMGELVRAYIVTKDRSVPYAIVLGSIGIERLFDLISVLAILGLVLAAGQNLPDAMRTAGYIVGFGCAVAILMTYFLAFKTSATITLICYLMNWATENLRKNVKMQLNLLAKSLQVIRQPIVLLLVITNSIVQWILMGLCIYFSLRAVGISVSPSIAAMVLAATIIGISLPTSPGYVGNIQLAFTLALAPYGIDAGAAVAASLYYHVLAYLSVLITGFYFLHRLGWKWRQLKREAENDFQRTHTEP